MFPAKIFRVLPHDASPHPANTHTITYLNMHTEQEPLSDPLPRVFLGGAHRTREPCSTSFPCTLLTHDRLIMQERERSLSTALAAHSIKLALQTHVLEKRFHMYSISALLNDTQLYPRIITKIFPLPFKISREQTQRKINENSKQSLQKKSHNEK